MLYKITVSYNHTKVNIYGESAISVRHFFLFFIKISLFYCGRTNQIVSWETRLDCYRNGIFFNSADITEDIGKRALEEAMRRESSWG